MKRIVLCLTFLGVCGGIFSQSISQKKKVVMILVDGIATDMLYKASTPVLDEMADKGGIAEAYVGGKRNTVTETPTISAVGYNSMLTGTWVNKHNVWGNKIVAPNYNYPTVFRLFKDTYPNKKTAIFSSWLDNRTKLVGDGLVETGSFKFDYHFDGLELDTLKYPHDKGKKYLKRIDGEVAREAANYIYENGPDLSWVYLEHTDDVGHLYGDSDKFYEIVTYEDALVGMIWDAVKLREKETGEDWLIVVTTDHGRHPEDGKHHGKQSNRERNTWIVLNKPIVNTYFQNNEVAIVDILPTITQFLEIEVPRRNAYEMEGISLIGTTDIFNLFGVCLGNQLYLNWFTEGENLSQAKVYISYTNYQKTGGKDAYVQTGDIELNTHETIFQITPPKDTEYIKVVVETKHNVATCWAKVFRQE